MQSLINKLSNEDVLFDMEDVEVDKLTKKYRVEKLIVLRRLYFDIAKDARSESEIKAREDFEKEYCPISLDGEFEELTTGRIFCLSDGVMNLDRYKSIS